MPPLTEADHAELALFAGSSARKRTWSPRAAFQAALHGRAAILDLRTGSERAREGELPAYVIDRDRTDASVVIALVGADGVALGLPAIEGGFAGWRLAGLPVHA